MARVTETRVDRNKVKRKAKRLIFVLIAAIIVIPVMIFFLPRKVYRSITVEAGKKNPEVYEFIRDEDVDGIFLTDLSSIDMSLPGVYKIKIQIGDKVHNSKLKIVDTTPPKAKIVNQEIPFGQTLKAKDFVTDIEDATEVNISFLEDPDFSVEGDQDVSLVLTDIEGNKTELTAALSIKKVHESVTLEISTKKLDIADFMMSDELEGSFITDVSSIDLNTLGEHDIVIDCQGKEYVSKLLIVDTTPPRADKIDLEAWAGDEIEAHSFVENIVDHTEVKVYYTEEPDFNKIGKQDIFITLEDTSGNTTQLTASLTTIADTEPPEIKGDDKQLVYIGEKVSYRKFVTVTDNKDKNVDLEIDASDVNLKKQGDYELVYRARDSANNTTTKHVIVTVKPKPENYVSKEEVDELADQVLDSIIEKDMSERDKAKAIYDWTRNNIKYIGDYANKTDWVRGAYDGIKRKKGDCYVYFATAKELLTRVGIENMDIVKNNERHFWNMVNLGEGWYHFDTTPRSRGGVFFMLTDAQLEAYSKNNKNSHVWDRDKYPATPLE